MANNQNIKLVAFDLGGVLINVDKSCVDAFYFQSSFFTDFTLGKITPSAYFDQLSRRTGRHPQELAHCFAKMIQPCPVSTTLLHSLRVPFTFWSNINLCHFEQILKGHKSFQKYSNAAGLSFLLGSMKPSLKFFEMCLENSRAESSQILFLDDKDENIRAAKTLGIRAERVDNPDHLLRILSCAHLLDPKAYADRN